MTVVYEWDVETVAAVESDDHEQDECVDHYHTESFAEAQRVAATQAPDGFRHQIVLVRDDDEGRSWAYVNGKLPEFFTDADGHDTARVPKRFHAELSASGKAG